MPKRLLHPEGREEFLHFLRRLFPHYLALLPNSHFGLLVLWGLTFLSDDLARRSLINRAVLDTLAFGNHWIAVGVLVLPFLAFLGGNRLASLAMRRLGLYWGWGVFFCLTVLYTVLTFTVNPGVNTIALIVAWFWFTLTVYLIQWEH